MGICYSEQQQWQAYQSNYRTRRKNKKKTDYSSIIYQQKSVYQSFTSKLDNSFRQDLLNTLNNIATQNGSIAIGSIAEMSQTDIDNLCKNLQLVCFDGISYDLNQVISLCNFKTKNFMHTHQIKNPSCRKFNQVSACPYNSNHMVEYDLWKFIPVGGVVVSGVVSSGVVVSGVVVSGVVGSGVIGSGEKYYIYHPLTQAFLSHQNGKVVCGDKKYQWEIRDFGRRRKGGFIKICTNIDEIYYQLCMTDQNGILANHRKLELCRNKHISHLWEINFGECLFA